MFQSILFGRFCSVSNVEVQPKKHIGKNQIFGGGSAEETGGFWANKVAGLSS